MDDILSNKDIRAAKAERRLGDHTLCVVCGESDPRCRELHHLAGQRYGDDLVSVCRNCHRKLSDDQRDHPEAKGPPSRLQEIGRFLIGLGDFLMALGIRLKELGQELFDMVCRSEDGVATC